MKFLVEKSEIDFGSTQIDNIFIEDYMPIANGAFVKVYLYAYKNMISECEDYSIDNIKLAKNLQLNIQDVEDAWSYWEREGLVERIFNIDESYDIEFKDLKRRYVQIGLSNSPNNRVKSKHETLIDVMEKTQVREMFSNVDYFMRRPTTPTEKMEILSWISDLNMGTEIIELAFEYCTEKKKKVNVNYVRAVVTNWSDNGLVTIEQVENEIKKSDEKYVRKNSVLRKLGLQNRSVSEPEIKLINSWYDIHKFSEDLIDEALSRTSKIDRPSINYVNSILMKWKELGIFSVEDIAEKDIKPLKKTTTNKSKFHNFKGESEGKSDSELNAIAVNLTRRRNVKGE